MTSIKRIVITSLGNPGQYRDTYHSIGHIALEALQKSLTHDQPPFTPEKIGSQYTLASVGPRITLWQSPSVMNYSGKWLNRAFTSYVKDNDLQLTDTALIVVHDELEAELGAIKTRAWGQSPRGHNGVKSLHESMRCRNYPWARLAVGTGRPSSRANHAVSEFVLSKVTNRCRSVIEETAPHGIFQAVTALVEGWEQEPAPKLEERGGPGGYLCIDWITTLR
ncbi:peptidyl-tRNA hydrolase [Lasiosphaeria miniovina]|uniref:peptidyl-tRNA hydrolase n=1 Tax=Lasiosphaeria miniovina TaxID=1954250 RepID=A0AA40B4S4_9PEZI|nr:peptidyl-tRNA hydrolase [Lasiosphaeria miniovina]KAK0727617.1 peptidyl-tRNA hydrolase [Lasiosphaeria miniovina]